MSVARKRNQIVRPTPQAIVLILQGLWTDICESITLLIVTVCTGSFLILAALNLFHVVSWPQALSVLGLSYTGIVQHLWLFQFFTAPLLHANLTHLAFNMLTLWMIGSDVEQILGRRRYTVFSLLCAACSMAGFLLFNWGSAVIGCGYSGVIFGLLVAQATFFPDRVIYIYAFFPLKMKHAVLVLGAAAFYLTVTPDRSGIAHAAHLFGALGGWVYLRAVQWRMAQVGSEMKRAKSLQTYRPTRRQQGTDIPWEL